MKTLLDSIFSENLPGIQKALDLTFRRNQAISSNIANAETPGYRAADLDFGHELEKAFGASSSDLQMTNPNHMDISGQSGAHLVQDYSGMTKPDGNNVDLDIQMGQLSYNKTKYIQATSLVRRQFSVLQNVIRSVG